MKILICSQYFWPEGFRINDVARSLVEQGHVVDVLTGKPNYPDGVVFPGYTAAGVVFEMWHGISVYRVPMLPRGNRSGFKLFLNYLSFIISALVCAPWILRKKKYDVIFVYGVSPIFQAVPASFLGWLKKCKVVLWVQDLWPQSAQATGYIKTPWVLKMIEQMVRFVYRHVDLLLVQSRAFEAAVGELAPGKRIVYFPNSVDPSFYSPVAGPVPDIPALTKEFSVLFAGNVGVGQAVEVIVEAAELLREHPDIGFVVLGKGSRWDWMNEQVRLRELPNVHLAGRFPVETMPGLMRNASALLVTLADQPIFAATVPSKVQAYMAVGRPIIACLNGEGARLIVEAGAGLATPAEDAKALTDAILHLYGLSPGERKILGDNGRRYYQEHFDHDVLIGQLIHQLQVVSVSGRDVK